MTQYEGHMITIWESCGHSMKSCIPSVGSHDRSILKGLQRIVAVWDGYFSKGIHTTNNLILQQEHT